eukprot:2619916-Amphidinium_carterae.1
MFEEAKAFNCDISGWTVCAAKDTSRMFCEAAAFSFIGLLKISWPLAPATCGPSTRELTPPEVTSCLAWSSSHGADQKGHNYKKRDIMPRASSTSSFVGITRCCLLLAGAPLAIFLVVRCAARNLLSTEGAFEFELRQPLVPEEDGLSLSTVDKGQFVRVIKSKGALDEACRQSGLPLQQRLACTGEVGRVLSLDQIDLLAWVALETRLPPCQGWFPLSCLQDAGPCPDLSLSSWCEPRLEDIMKTDMIELSEGTPSPWGFSASASETRGVPLQQAVDSLPRATFNRSVASEIHPQTPCLLE